MVIRNKVRHFRVDVQEVIRDLTSAAAILTVFISCPSFSGRWLAVCRNAMVLVNGACQSQAPHMLVLFKHLYIVVYDFIGRARTSFGFS